MVQGRKAGAVSRAVHRPCERSKFPGIDLGVSGTLTDHSRSVDARGPLVIWSTSLGAQLDRICNLDQDCWKTGSSELAAAWGS